MGILMARCRQYTGVSSPERSFKLLRMILDMSDNSDVGLLVNRLNWNSWIFCDDIEMGI
jgi:hypothetical protein